MSNKADGPPLVDYVFDQRYGVLFKVVVQGRAPENAEEGVVEALEEGVRLVEAKAVNKDLTHQITTTLPQLPETQIFFGKRRETFPPVLVAVNIIGTESKAVVPTYKFAPEGLLPARTTRSFSFGPPEAVIDVNGQFAAQPFHGVIEYLESRANSGTNSGTHTSSDNSQGTSTGAETSTSNSAHSSTSASAETSRRSGTDASTSVGSGSQTSDTTSTSTHAGTDTNTRSGDETSNHTTSANGSGSNQTSSTESGTSSGTGTQTQSGTNNQTQHRDHLSNDSTTSTDSGAPLVGDPTINRSSIGETDDVTNSTHSSTGVSSHTGTNSGTHTTNSSNTHVSDQTTTSTGGSSGSSTSTGSGSSMNHSVSSGTNTHSNLNSGTSQSSSAGSGTGANSGTNQNSGSSTSSGTRTSTGMSDSVTTGTSNSTSQGLNLLPVSFPPTLHESITFSGLTIPATVPTDLPWESWVTVADTSEHWKNGVWARELIEVLLPESPAYV